MTVEGLQNHECIIFYPTFGEGSVYKIIKNLRNIRWG